MVTIHTAYTAPINPPFLSPLTASQVWAGLQRKVRRAQDFVPAITACEVLEEKDDGKTVVRRIRFKETPETWVEERCVESEGVKVDFFQEDGSVITNIISQGPSGKEDDLHMTYVFEWRHPDVEEGSEQVKELEGKHRALAKMSVDKSIESIRRLVGEGVVS